MNIRYGINLGVLTSAAILLNLAAVAIARTQSCLVNQDGVETCFSAPEATVCPVKELLTNFLWFNEDALKNPDTARTRGILLRAESQHDVKDIVKYYKHGQRHNDHAAHLIDQCNSLAKIDVATSFAEAVRIQDCGNTPPVQSATCNDLRENIRWSLINSEGCAPYARDYVLSGVDSTDFLWRRADLIRRGIKVAQSHNGQVWDSVDFISDPLLVRIASEIVNSFDVRSLDRQHPDNESPFAKQDCQGLGREAKILPLNEQPAKPDSSRQVTTETNSDGPPPSLFDSNPDAPPDSIFNQ